MTITWVLVANGSSARLFEWQRSAKRLAVVSAYAHPESRSHRRDLRRDRPGLFGQRRRRPGSFVEATDRKKHEMEAFARQLAGELQVGASSHAYDRLVLIAPPGLCGSLKAVLAPVAKKLLWHVVAKDYTGRSETELLRLLARTLPALALEGERPDKGVVAGRPRVRTAE